MSEEKQSPAAQQSGASDAATSKPAQVSEDIQKIRDGIFKEARETYEPKLEKAKAKADELEAKFKAERDWRMGVLDTRAKGANVTETAMRLAREKGPEDYEKLIAEFEGLKTSKPAETPKPAPQPGGLVGGEELPGINLDDLSPSKNGGRVQPLLEAYAKYGKAKVDAALAARK